MLDAPLRDGGDVDRPARLRPLSSGTNWLTFCFPGSPCNVIVYWLPSLATVTLFLPTLDSASTRLA